MNRIAEQVKQQISMNSLLEHYGFEVGRGGFLLCPFHSEHTPSLKVYANGTRWKCFGCGEGGTVIDFAMLLFRLTPYQAALRLNADFRLGLGGEEADPRALSRMRKERAREARELREFRAGDLSKCAEAREIRGIPPPWRGMEQLPEAGEYAALLGRLDWLDYYFAETEWR